MKVKIIPLANDMARVEVDGRNVAEKLPKDQAKYWGEAILQAFDAGKQAKCNEILGVLNPPKSFSHLRSFNG